MPTLGADERRGVQQYGEKCLVGLQSRAAYHASKHGVIGLTRSAAIEYTPRGVPHQRRLSWHDRNTDGHRYARKASAEAMKEIMREQPIGRLGRSDEIAAAVLWLCSPGASFVLGIALPVDGGFAGSLEAHDHDH